MHTAQAAFDLYSTLHHIKMILAHVAFKGCVIWKKFWHIAKTLFCPSWYSSRWNWSKFKKVFIFLHYGMYEQVIHSSLCNETIVVMVKQHSQLLNCKQGLEWFAHMTLWPWEYYYTQEGTKIQKKYKLLQLLQKQYAADIYLWRRAAVCSSVHLLAVQSISVWIRFRRIQYREWGRVKVVPEQEGMGKGSVIASS